MRTEYEEWKEEVTLSATARILIWIIEVTVMSVSHDFRRMSSSAQVLRALQQSM